MEHGAALSPDFHLYMLLYFQLTFAYLDSTIYCTLFKFYFSKEIILFGYPQCHVYSLQIWELTRGSACSLHAGACA